MNSATLVFAGF